MITVSKILAAVDGSEPAKRAFEHALFLAKERMYASLLLVNIAVFERVGSSSKKLEEIAKKLRKENLMTEQSFLRSPCYPTVP